MGVRFVLGILLLLGCSQAGDEDDADGNGNSGGGGKPSKPGDAEPSNKITLATVSVRLPFGARMALRGRLRNAEGEAIEDGRLSFALIGASQDSSLDVIDVRSDNSGSFQNALQAGEHAAAFIVRVSAEDAANAIVDVSVSDAGVGSLLVTADYDGPRVVLQRSVFARANGKCDGSERGDDDSFATLSDKQTEARLPGLPVAPTYAVTVLAEGPSGMPVASGCVEGVVLQADSDLVLEVPFSDVPLQRSGAFTLQADLDMVGPAGVLTAAMSSAAEAVIVGSVPGQPAPDEPQARFLLNTLQEFLDSEAAPTGGAELGQDLAIDRDNDMTPNPTPDHGLQGVLEIADRGPLLVIADLAQSTQGELARMRLTSALALAPKGSPAATWQPLQIEALPIEDAAPIAIDLRMIDTDPTVRATFDGDRDVLDLSRIGFRAQLGELAKQVLRGALQSEDEGGRLESLRELLGCALLSDWLEDQAAAQTYRGACDEDCVQTACDLALGRLQVAGEGALSDLDVARPTVTLGGELVLHDANGDLVAESMDCDLFQGEWAAERKGAKADAITGTAHASLATEPDN